LNKIRAGKHGFAMALTEVVVNDGLMPGIQHAGTHKRASAEDEPQPTTPGAAVGKGEAVS
jgi:hypothetical protein